MTDVVVYCFANGNVAVFRCGQQQPDLQEPWILEIAKRLEKAGVDPTSATWHMPDGRRARLYAIKLEGGTVGYNWEMSSHDDR